MAYNKDTDYQALINEAIAKGDYRAAAGYEQQRNEKIKSEGLNYGTTSNYANWLDSGNSPTGSATGIGVNTTDQQAIKDEMNYNSMQWANATDAGKDSLHAENEWLASLLGPGVSYDPTTGAWSGDADKAQVLMPSNDFSNPQPTFESSYSSQIDQLLDQILNREDFSYDFNNDPLYQQYASQYAREGNRAMNDTLAAAAANAGGMNSYAITAAQQANNYYAAQAADKIPELAQLAYEMYLDDIDFDMQKSGLLTQLDDTQYNRYRDTMSDWRDDRNFAYNQYRDNMGDYKWQTELDYNIHRYDNEWNYGVSQDTYDRAMEMLASGAMPDSSMLDSAGITQEQANAIFGTYGYSVPGTSGGSSVTGGTPVTGDTTENVTGGSGYDNGGLTDAQVRELQSYYGANEDGKWGANSTDAAGGLSADEAWAEYQKAMEESEEITEDDVAAAVNALGIGMVDMDTVQEIMNFRGIIESNGKFVWINGWSKENWQSKLAENRERQNFITRNTK